MKKLAKTWSIAKQGIKEKIGKAEASVNSEEVNTARETFVTIKKGCGDISSNGKALCTEGWPLMVAQSEVLAESMIAFAASLKSETNPSLADVITALTNVGNTLHSVDQINNDCIAATRQRISGTIGNMNDNTIKHVQELRYQQELARLQLEAALSSAGPISTTETRGQYDKITAQFMEEMKGLEGHAMKIDLVQCLQDFVDAQLKATSQALQVWLDCRAHFERLGGDLDENLASSQSNSRSRSSSRSSNVEEKVKEPVREDEAPIQESDSVADNVGNQNDENLEFVSSAQVQTPTTSVFFYCG
jgi:hypothetical protein